MSEKAVHRMCDIREIVSMFLSMKFDQGICSGTQNDGIPAHIISFFKQPF